MLKNRRLNKLEQAVKPKNERLMVMYTDWELGEEPPDEEIQVSVSYYDDREPETMSLAEYKVRFPDWEQEEKIVVGWEE